MEARWWIAGVLAALLVSCAYTPQTVSLKPQVQVSETEVGRGQTVGVTSVDERPSSAIGNRATPGMSAEITSDPDVAPTVQGALTEGLRRQGFNPVAATGEDARALRVEIRNVEYKISAGIFSSKLRTEAVLKGICILGTARPYERLYRGQKEKNIMVVQSESQNEELLNEALSQAINSLLKDSELLKCLAR